MKFSLHTYKNGEEKRRYSVDFAMLMLMKRERKATLTGTRRIETWKRMKKKVVKLCTLFKSFKIAQPTGQRVVNICAVETISRYSLNPSLIYVLLSHSFDHSERFLSHFGSSFVFFLRLSVVAGVYILSSDCHLVWLLFIENFFIPCVSLFSFSSCAFIHVHLDCSF